jgi:hypothetical protein
MGQAEANMGPPTVRLVYIDGVPHLRIELNAGCEHTFGHVATGAGEMLTLDQWLACLMAAKQGFAPLRAALMASNAAPWFERLVARTNTHMQWPAVRALMVRRFADTWAELDTEDALRNKLLAA